MKAQVLLIRALIKAALSKCMAGSHFSFMAKAEAQSKQSLKFSSILHLAYEAILLAICEFRSHVLCNSTAAGLCGKKSQSQLESHTCKTFTLLYDTSKKEKFC